MLISDKASIRRTVLAERDGKDEAWRAEHSAAIAAQARIVVPKLGAGPVAGYWPFGSEADPRPLMEAIAREGFQLCLPVIKHPEIFYRRFSFGDALADAGWGTFGPVASAPEVRPATLLVPLAAFDHRGGRIGWGKGHYDRSIARLYADGSPLVTIGVAFSLQQVESVPVEPHDRQLDYVVTDTDFLQATP